MVFVKLKKQSVIEINLKLFIFNVQNHLLPNYTIMEKYILDLIKDHNRVIVPNFGAFIVSREKGQTILFNSFLSFNDGLLINHICKADSIETPEATTMVEEYVTKVKAALDTKGIFEMDELGTFSKDQNGILRFIQKEPEGIPKPEIKSSKPAKATDSSDLLDIDASGVTGAVVIEETIKLSEPASKEKLLIIDNTLPATPAPAPTPTPTPKPVVETKKPVSKPMQSQKTTKEIIHTERRGLPLWLIILLIMLPLILLLIYFLFIKDGGIKLFKTKTPPPVEQAVIEEKPEEPVVEAPAPVEPAPVLGTRQHHIILGSFKDEANANQLLSKLKEKGYSNASSFNYQGRVLVSAEWHTSVNKALERQEELLKELQMENWVLTLK